MSMFHKLNEHHSKKSIHNSYILWPPPPPPYPHPPDTQMVNSVHLSLRDQALYQQKGMRLSEVISAALITVHHFLNGYVGFLVEHHKRKFGESRKFVTSGSLKKEKDKIHEDLKKKKKKVKRHNFIYNSKAKVYKNITITVA